MSLYNTFREDYMVLFVLTVLYIYIHSYHNKNNKKEMAHLYINTYNENKEKIFVIFNL